MHGQQGVNLVLEALDYRNVCLNDTVLFQSCKRVPPEVLTCRLGLLKRLVLAGCLHRCEALGLHQAEQKCCLSLLDLQDRVLRLGGMLATSKDQLHRLSGSGGRGRGWLCWCSLDHTFFVFLTFIISIKPSNNYLSKINGLKYLSLNKFFKIAVTLYISHLAFHAYQ